MLIAKCIPNNRFFPHQSINTVWMPFKSELGSFEQGKCTRHKSNNPPPTTIERTRAPNFALVWVAVHAVITTAPHGMPCHFLWMRSLSPSLVSTVKLLWGFFPAIRLRRSLGRTAVWRQILNPASKRKLGARPRNCDHFVWVHRERERKLRRAFLSVPIWSARGAIHIRLKLLS